MNQINVGDYYRHFKGFRIQIIALSKHTETEEELVTYKELSSGNVWSRPLAMFLSEVDHEKYPDVKQKYRFEKE